MAEHNYNWSKTKGGNYGIDASELPREDIMLFLPEIVGKISFRDFIPRKDEEGETYCWVYYRDGVQYTIFND